MADKPEIDQHTGIETTGHSWDGIKELNTPLPRWWIWVFYICIVWAVGYWVAYPAWPMFSDYTRGMLGYSERAAVNAAVAEDKKAQGKWNEAIAKAKFRGDQYEPGTPELLHRCWPLGLRKQLCRLPWPRRARRRRLSQPERRSLALGRHARGDRSDDPSRRSQWQ